MRVITKELSYNSKGNTDIIELSADLEKLLNNQEIDSGLMTVFVVGSTAGITTIEYESGLVEDFQKMFERLMPQNIRYAHNDRRQDGNGYAHIRASLLGSSCLIPLVNHKLCLGTWQQVILVDFDNRPRKRKIIVQIMGE